MEIYKIGDRVTRNTNPTQIGRIVGIWEEERFLDEKLLANRGDYKVQFDFNTDNGFITCSANEIKKT